jgi:hypothetical protein
MDMILDGRKKFDCSLMAFYAQPVIVSQLARLGISVAPLTAVAEDAPVAAEINVLDGVPRWIVSCPSCQYGASYVWLEEPFMFCVNCGNEAVGHRWRPVVVPKERAQIERLLMQRTDPNTRNWKPGETLADVRALNARAGA